MIMKKLIVLFILIVLYSCTKDEPVSKPSVFNGFGTANINGKEYMFKPSMKYHESLGRYGIILVYFENEIQRAKIHFAKVSNENSLQTLHKYNDNIINTQCGFYTSILDGDVAGNYYFLNEKDSIEDYLLLTSFDMTTGEVKGEFQASFYVDTAKIFDHNFPDTIVITNGYFETTVLDE